ncbi:hypothetical protein [Paenibacillus riograndensis]|nr:hypothetical protein [Paenibacillus riograndensis]
MNQFFNETSADVLAGVFDLEARGIFEGNGGDRTSKLKRALRV